MILRDKIQEYKIEEIEDGMGGVSEELTSSALVSCKVSVSNDVAKATAYGVLAEQVLEVISAASLNKDSMYEYGAKKYSVRKCLNKGRFYYSTLVEVA